MNDAQQSGEARFVRRVLIVVAITAGVLLLWQVRDVVVLLFGAVMIATIFRAIADLLEKHLRLPERIAVLVSVLLIVGIVVSIVWIDRLPGRGADGAGLAKRCRARRPSSTNGWAASGCGHPVADVRCAISIRRADRSRISKGWL